MKSCYRSRRSKTEKFVQKTEKVEEAYGIIIKHCRKTKTTSWNLSEAVESDKGHPILPKKKIQNTYFKTLFV